MVGSTIYITKRVDVKNSQVYEFTPIIESNKKLYILYGDKFLKEYSTMINDPDLLEQDDIHYTSNKYINIQLVLPKGKHDEIKFATVKHRITDEHNLPIGTTSKYAALDTSKYEVEYLDGTLETISANIIAYNIMSQVDSDGHQQYLLDEMVDHRNDSTALSTGTNMYHDSNGITKQRYTAMGHQVCAQWKDGSSN